MAEKPKIAEDDFVKLLNLNLNFLHVLMQTQILMIYEGIQKTVDEILIFVVFVICESSKLNFNRVNLEKI